MYKVNLMRTSRFTSTLGAYFQIWLFPILTYITYVAALSVWGRRLRRGVCYHWMLSFPFLRHVYY